MTNKQAAIKVIRRLNRNGFQALMAGGCVRDMLLGKRPKDYDVATDAQPKEVIGLFKRTLKVGAKFGVVIVMLEGRQVEVATFRTETGYADGRHPSVVKFANAAEDASRRDFTINGMFYDPVKDKVIDYVDGRADLKKGLIRTIGKPKERFGEDYLRMLRAVRFSTQLGFDIEPATWSEICRNAKKITKISGERIAIELEAILVDPNRSVGAAMLAETGLAKAIFPGFSARHAEFAVSVLAQLRKKVDFALALASLFAGCPTDFARQKHQILKLSRSQNKHIKFLLANRGRLLDDRMPLSRLKMILAEPYFWNLYELQRAIQKATPDGAKGIAALGRLRKRIKDLGDVELRPKPLLSGHDLIRLGAVPGPALGQLAEEMYIAQLEGKLKTLSQARQWAQKWLQKRRMTEK
ncbi:MAG: CCA tRNA nucleotidyltransferase [Phycisphaerae bacterium]|nr:CCA tRNA nucleotidyltransferase [Phycisphaerae bacterium]NIP53203.1 CCA tRNA nucleotidyltransferase [Phycisphaerae bacterium]NIS52238.1 CCA tRNA nucleotidyltransferase [Phycisphaerae bacterium]NIU09764.1 CCA tRNA nucleotidyltransferase [Phycisphaerae bacterium]NIU59184.1 CCA tRNA nucleotidyltransferase [Phycisphaerae bacterium]